MTNSRTSLLSASSWTMLNTGAPVEIHAWTPYYLRELDGVDLLVTIDGVVYGNAEWMEEYGVYRCYSPYTGRETACLFRDDALEWMISESLSRPYGSALLLLDPAQT